MNLKPRPLYLKKGIIAMANGSAYIEQGNTKIISSVYGPREIIKKEEFSLDGQISVDFQFAPFSSKTRQILSTQEILQQSLFIKDAIQPAIIMNKFPKSCIDIYIIVLENDGSAFSSTLTCLSYALIDAGVELYDIVIGANIINDSTNFILDPSFMEENEPSVKTKMTIGYMPTLNQVTAIFQNGCISTTTAKQMLKHCLDACTKLTPIIQKTILQNLENN